ncbi:hypothetical protein SAMN04244579_04877, partial [Azotobacter beijerinckii]
MMRRFAAAFFLSLLPTLAPAADVLSPDQLKALHEPHLQMRYRPDDALLPLFSGASRHDAS